MACARPKNIIQSTEIKNKQLKFMLEKEIENNKQKIKD